MEGVDGGLVNFLGDYRRFCRKLPKPQISYINRISSISDMIDCIVQLTVHSQKLSDFESRPKTCKKFI
jgi:hypothetical protein